MGKTECNFDTDESKIERKLQPKTIHKQAKNGEKSI